MSCVLSIQFANIVESSTYELIDGAPAAQGTQALLGSLVLDDHPDADTVGVLVGAEQQTVGAVVREGVRGRAWEVPFSIESSNEDTVECGFLALTAYSDLALAHTHFRHAGGCKQGERVEIEARIGVGLAVVGPAGVSYLVGDDKKSETLFSTAHTEDFWNLSPDAEWQDVPDDEAPRTMLRMVKLSCEPGVNDFTLSVRLEVRLRTDDDRTNAAATFDHGLSTSVKSRPDPRFKFDYDAVVQLFVAPPEDLQRVEEVLENPLFSPVFEDMD